MINPIWSAYSFFTLYANIDDYQATFINQPSNTLDKYILAKTHQLVTNVTEYMDKYDLPGATNEIRGFIDALNNWYIRRSRDRFWSPAKPIHDRDKQDAYDTLFTVLHALCKLSAPFLPMVSEEIFKGLTRELSVHEDDWPLPQEFRSDSHLVETMDLVRNVVSAALRLREDAGLRVRLPLQSITIASSDIGDITDFEFLIQDEINVKTVIYTDDLAAYGNFSLKPNGKVLGPRLGSDVQNVFRAAKTGDWERLNDGRVKINDYVLESHEFELNLVANEGTTATSLPGDKAVVVLDIELTDSLLKEGKARDAVRAIQEARKEMNLILTDRIHLNIVATGETTEAIKSYSDYICDQVLGKSLTFNEADEDLEVFTGSIDGEEIGIQIRVG
ncbi:MAG: hypothetical protein Ct9H90mP11_09470 [Acidimicrobiales bacterium]|nr:MAG: hypothetical protein Ct9H90mP11_09470 [Acidimicrobiales bacterium]